jgi:hypothetical protein
MLDISSISVEGGLLGSRLASKQIEEDGALGNDVK